MTELVGECQPGESRYVSEPMSRNTGETWGTPALTFLWLLIGSTFSRHCVGPPLSSAHLRCEAYCRVFTMRNLLWFALFTFLNVGVIFAQTASTASRNSAAQEYSFSVPASQVWVDTNIDLAPGDGVHISGAVIACAGPTPTENQQIPLRSAPAGALLAKVHAEADPVSATPDAELAISEPSHLFLGVNGWRCSGKIPAKVRVEHRAAASRK
jgi:hypothetical protein